VSLVIGEELQLAYGPKVLLDDASFTIGPSDRIGLVGANGTGKSSLLKILAGVLSPDGGRLHFRRGARVGWLPQDLAAAPRGTVIESVLAAVPGRGELEKRLAEAEAGLQVAREEADQLELSQALADLHERLERFEERFGRRRAERILVGLGFTEDRFDRPAAELSGGWRMRAGLAGLLLMDPDLLLLDEPTNHLDIPTLEWFDGFLRQSGRALMLISHDRDFLNRQIDRVLSLELEGLRAYAGDWDDYRRQRAEEEVQLRARAERQAARRAELEGFIERFGAKNTKASQAQSKRKMLERMEEVQVLEERATLRFRFPEPPRSGREVVRLEGIGKSYGERVVYRGLEATIQRGERVGVIGANGAGKSTLLKLVAGVVPPDAGAVTLGSGVLPGYYAQHHDAGGAEQAQRRILDVLWDLVPDRGEGFVRSIAGSFLFSGDDVEKPLAVLSGGERARVALAKLLLVPGNFLILDEPTNHLDLSSSEALIEALQGYAGTLLFVSHNRSFLNQLATQIWDVRDGTLERHPGNLDDYLYHLRGAAAGAGEAAAPVAAGREAAGGRAAEKARRHAEAQARNARSARERPIREEIGRIERRIAELELESTDLQTRLADPGLYQDFTKARPLVERQQAVRAELEGLYGRWAAENERLEEAADPPAS
jgi:ATP-binding cassette subfamily F protein 3